MSFGTLSGIAGLARFEVCRERYDNLFGIYWMRVFYEIPGGGKGSHRKFTHVRYSGAVTISGASGDDAKYYQEKQVRLAIERIKQ